MWPSRSPTSSSAGSATPSTDRARALRNRDRRLEPEQAAERAADHGGLLVGGDVTEQALNQLPAPAERPLGVRVVVAPHDARHTRDVPARDRDRVVLERDVELARDVVA